MANVRLNVFENNPVQFLVGNGAAITWNTLSVQQVYIPGSISFNSVIVGLSGSGGVSENMTGSFGLYSLNGSTLSLANSASYATGLTLNQTMLSFLTLATSATQDITPGNWFLAMIFISSLGSSFSFINNQGRFLVGGGYGGPFFRGVLSTSTNALPASIATSDMNKEGSVATSLAQHSYIVISA